MKRTIVALLVVLFVSLPAMAASPAGSYDEELHGRHRAESTIRPQVEVNVGFITGGKLRTNNFGKLKTNLSRPYVDVIAGVRLNEFLFAGVGVGVQYVYGDCRLVGLATENAPDTWGAVGIPIYANVKGCFPVNSLITPYLSVSLGGSVIASSNFGREGYGTLRGGLLCKFGAGLTVSRFNFGLGLASQSMKWLSPTGVTNFKAGNNAFYIEAGVCF